MIIFNWHRRDYGHGIVWQLWTRYNATMIGSCIYLPGSKHYQARASAPVKGGAVLTDYRGGTMRAAMGALERDWSKRSIGLFGEDDIQFQRFS
jgi:hypothetical protein